METQSIINISIPYDNKFTYYIARDTKDCLNLKSFRKKIRKDLGSLNGEIVYLYFFTDRKIKVTEENNIVYIGKSVSKKQKPYERFLHEIYKDNTKKDSAKQYTLTHSYRNNIPLQLEIFFVNNATMFEQQLLSKHKEMFGYLPIANGREE